MKQGRETTKEERLEIVKECLASGKNYGEIALKYQESYQQVRTWTLRFEEMGAAKDVRFGDAKCILCDAKGVYDVVDRVYQHDRECFYSMDVIPPEWWRNPPTCQNA